jgi:integrase
VALSWDDIDCENEVLHVAKARKWTPDGWVIGPPKTRRGQRALKMPPSLAEAFRRMVPKEPHELVFATSSKTLLSPSGLRKRLICLCAKAGIEPLTPYELRHSAASLLSDNGVPIEILADLLGHTSTHMLEQVYRHRVRKVIDVTSRGALSAGSS